MKTATLICIAISCVVTSCYKVYDPKIDSSEKVLVVNGMMTNKKEAYHVFLTSARPFNSTEEGLPERAANVYATDDLGNSYKFNENDNGDYISDSLRFTGIAGHSYSLHIVTRDGEVYKSDPQRLFPESYPDAVYAEFDNHEILDKSTGLKINTHGADVLIDIRTKADTLSRFRFTSNLVRQYFYVIYPYLKPSVSFYCWQTVDANSNINLTDAEYSLNSASIRKHQICFLDDNLLCSALYYSYKENPYTVVLTNSYRTYEIHHRILYLNQYTLNNETYLYYKSLDEQMQSEGKLFDPIATQLNGNIKCITNPEKKAIGFFEASSVSYSAYVVDFRNLINSQPSIIKTPYVLPPESKGCWINKIPPFWIN